MNYLKNLFKRVVFKKLVSYFFQGVVLTAPIFATVYVIWSLFNFVDTQVNDLIESLFGIRIPILGVIAMLVFITVIGFIGSTIILRPIIFLVEEILEHTPVVKTIYSSLKDFISAFVSNKKRFNNPVLVEFGKNSGIYKLGFITQHDLSDLNIKDMVAVYMPHSYNFSGNLYIVKTEQVQSLSDEVDKTDLMKFIVTGGISELEDDDENSNRSGISFFNRIKKES